MIGIRLAESAIVVLIVTVLASAGCSSNKETAKQNQEIKQAEAKQSFSAFVIPKSPRLDEEALPAVSGLLEERNEGNRRVVLSLCIDTESGAPVLVGNDKRMGRDKWKDYFSRLAVALKHERQNNPERFEDDSNSVVIRGGPEPDPLLASIVVEFWIGENVLCKDVRTILLTAQELGFEKFAFAARASAESNCAAGYIGELRDGKANYGRQNVERVWLRSDRAPRAADGIHLASQQRAR